MGGARDSSSLPLYYSGAGKQGGQSGSGSGSGGTTLPLNPTTLAMLQQHNYIPYFRGIVSGHKDPGLDPVPTHTRVKALNLH